MAVFSLAVAALAVSAVGTVGSIIQAKKGRKKGVAANEAQKKLNRKKNAQAKRAFLRQFQQAQAASLVAGIASGVGLESSIVQGQLASQATQAATAIKEFKEFDVLGAQVGDLRQAAASAASRSQTFGQVASFASQFISFPSGGGGTITETDIPNP